MDKKEAALFFADHLESIRARYMDDAGKLYVRQFEDALAAIRKPGCGGDCGCAKPTPGKVDLPRKLRDLANHMDRVATDVDYYGGFAEWSRHGVEMAGAAAMIRHWADEIGGSNNDDA